MEFQIRVTLYDAANKYFFGSTWLGAYLPWRKMDDGRAKILCNEVMMKYCMYIYTMSCTLNK